MYLSAYLFNSVLRVLWAEGLLHFTTPDLDNTSQQALFLALNGGNPFSHKMRDHGYTVDDGNCRLVMEFPPIGAEMDPVVDIDENGIHLDTVLYLTLQCQKVNMTDYTDVFTVKTADIALSGKVSKQIH